MILESKFFFLNEKSYDKDSRITPLNKKDIL